jgi:hypothetical protein
MIAALIAWLVTAQGGAAGAASAAPPAGVRLVWERRAGAESCPGGDDLRAAVVRRLGFDPFDDAAPREIRCVVRRDEGTFRARIEVAGQPGSPAGGRELTSRRADCAELAESIELAVGIAIQPLFVPRSVPVATAGPTEPPPSGGEAPPPLPAATSDPPPPVPAAAAARVPVAPPPPPAASVVKQTIPAPSPVRGHEVGVHAGLVGAVGLAPGAAPGAGVGASLRRRSLSLEVEARILGGSSAVAAGGSVSASVWIGSVGPCLHRGMFAACVAGTAGALRAHGNGFATTADATAPYLAVGASGLVEVPIGDRFRLRWQAELSAPLVTVHLVVDGQDAWTSPRVGILSSIGLGMIFR